MLVGDQKRLHAIVRGRVQGVGFRASTQTRAAKLGLTGYVRNQADGSVEVVAEGPRAMLDVLLDYLHTGPQNARVDQVTYEWMTATGGYRGFTVR